VLEHREASLSKFVRLNVHKLTKVKSLSETPIRNTSSDAKKSRISLWKFITSWLSHRIGQNFLIKLKLSNCDKINVYFCKLMLLLQRNSNFKKCKQTSFWAKMRKSGQMKLIFFTFLFIFNFFKWYLNLEKFIKLNSLIKDFKLPVVSRNWNIVNAKKK